MCLQSISISLHDSRRSKSAGDVTMDANPTTRNAPLVDKNPRQAFAEGLDCIYIYILYLLIV